MTLLQIRFTMLNAIDHFSISNQKGEVPQLTMVYRLYPFEPIAVPLARPCCFNASVLSRRFFMSLLLVYSFFEHLFQLHLLFLENKYYIISFIF